MKKKQEKIPFPLHGVDEFNGKFLNSEIDDVPKEETPQVITPDTTGMSVYFPTLITNHDGNEFF